MVQGSGNLKSVINLSEEESRNNISQFDLKETSAMNELITQLYLSKTVDKSRVLVKK